MDNFQQRKQDILDKQDKSSIGEWDEKIVKLCEKINKFENYYTTSSCSGRIVVLNDKEVKQKGLFLGRDHDFIDLERFLKGIPKEVAQMTLKYKQEPPILHVHCKTLEDAQELLRKAQLAGWKRSGIISSGERFILEMNGTEKLEFPLMKKGKLLVDNDFLKIVIEKSNKNLKKGWLKIDKLRKSL